MADLLLELLSEEIPARMQKNACDTLKSMLEGLFKDAGLSFKALEAYSTPRRITAHVTGLPVKTKDISEQRRGPKVGAPDQAVAGFSRGAGVNPDQLTKKDGYYYAKIEQKGADTLEVLSKALPGLIAKFPWPKSMRWGTGKFRWVRPLHSILCILDGKVVPFEVDGVKSGDTTRGHRFMSEGSFSVKDFSDYKHQLNKRHVMLDPDDRKRVILAEVEKIIKNQELEALIDDGLLNEVSGLVEWPVAQLGSFDKAFLDIPEEALMSEMRHHQKYFPVRNTKTGKLSNHFVFVSNMVTDDKGAAIIKGNERVLSARLHDAKFFWDQDRKVKLEDRLPALQEIVFHEKLGTVADRAARIEKLAGEIAGFIPGCDKKKAMRAAKLAKADLVSGMVGEFPDLQGIMGGYYAKEQGEEPEVWAAIKVHYSPKGPNDRCPKNPVSIALALADKLELLSSMFGIDEKPTGSKDPYALRRAALGVIRLILENNLLHFRLQHELGISDDVMAFLADRLKVQQKEKGVRHDLIEAVFSLGHEDDLVRILARVSALQKFLKTKDGENLLVGHKRAVNILRIEESKDSRSYLDKIDPKLLKEKAEIELWEALGGSKKAFSQAEMEEDFIGLMKAVAKLRAPIDAFFDNVKVNTDELEGKLRENRLRLLANIRLALMPIADFSKIEG
ncbi:MAG: glycine--tRNA ligase subunit beta [Alphaproteobacteria bacterium]